ncbi:MAG: hypothetical protein N3F06_02605 [Nitrososphaerales archaeon]|nr:hypothetical protein [Nitrososphaerales archaeon]
MQTGMWVLYEIYKGKMTVNVRVPKRKRVEEYLKIQGRFAHLTEDMIEEIQKQVDEYVAEINKMVGEEVIGPVEG